MMITKGIVDLHGGEIRYNARRQITANSCCTLYQTFKSCSSRNLCGML
jgi:hypothetical protein